jgi:hypothetical protein
MTRTTLDLDASVLDQLRRRAHAERKSMGQLASERLALVLGDEEANVPTTLSWPQLRMGAPKMDLRDKDALWKLLDGERSGSSPR